jgi:hypothetical protein
MANEMKLPICEKLRRVEWPGNDWAVPDAYADEAADLIEEMYEALQQYEAFLERTIAMVTGGADVSDAKFATSMNTLLDMSAAALSKARGE